MGILRSMFFMSVDGVVSSPADWHFPNYSEEMGEDLAATLDTTAAMVLGRVTYEEFAGYWPHQPADAPFAEYNNTIRKFVASTTLDKVEWTNSELLGPDVAGRLRSLKQELDGDLHVTGSATLVRWLLAEGLLDEIRLQISPVLVGTGQRLFCDSTTPAAMELVNSKPLPHGVMSLTYRIENR